MARSMQEKGSRKDLNRAKVATAAGAAAGMASGMGVVRVGPVQKAVTKGVAKALSNPGALAKPKKIQPLPNSAYKRTIGGR